MATPELAYTSYDSSELGVPLDESTPVKPIKCGPISRGVTYNVRTGTVDRCGSKICFGIVFSLIAAVGFIAFLVYLAIKVHSEEPSVSVANVSVNYTD